MASAQQYAQMTDLHKRVREWEEKVHPLLQQEVSVYCVKKYFSRHII